MSAKLSDSFAVPKISELSPTQATNPKPSVLQETASMKQTLLSTLFFISFSSVFAQTDSVAVTDSLTQDASYHKHKPAIDEIPAKGFSIGFSAGLAESYRNLLSKPYSELVIYRNAHETPIQTPEIGINLAYRFNRHLQINCGIRYIETGYDLNEEEHLNDTLDYEFGVACDVYHPVDPYGGWTGIGFSDPRYNYVIDGLHGSTGTLQTKVRYSYIDFPVSLRYSLGKRKLKGFIEAGLSTNWMLADKSTTVFDAGNSGTYTAYAYGLPKNTTKPFDFIRRWNFSYLAAIGTSYYFHRNWSVNLKAECQQQLESVFNYARKADYIEKHYRLGLTAGVDYSFQK